MDTSRDVPITETKPTKSTNDDFKKTNTEKTTTVKPKTERPTPEKKTKTTTTKNPTEKKNPENQEAEVMVCKLKSEKNDTENDKTTELKRKIPKRRESTQIIFDKQCIEYLQQLESIGMEALADNICSERLKRSYKNSI